LDRELKRQIKEDEFVSTLERVVMWANARRDEVRIAAGVVVVLGAAAAAFFYFQGQRAREAESAYQEALDIWRAPVEAELPPSADKPTGQVFATADEKYKSAAAAFEGVERRYPSRPEAESARYYAALCRERLKQYDEAEKGLKALADRKAGTRLEPTVARIALADLYRQRGQVDKAVESYRAVVADRDFPFPRDYALMSLAATLEQANRLAEARASYKRLTEDFPASVYAAEAKRRAERLQATS
jgi:tetratricopeptide (TPR) repeat protein